MANAPVNRVEVIDALSALGIPDGITSALPPLSTRVSALLVYGSRARGDAVADSDLDLLALVDEPMPSESSGAVSVSFYTQEQLKTGIGTLFGAHLRRDAKILWDPHENLAAVIADLGDVDTARLFARVEAMSEVFGSPQADLPKYLPGLLREARYLLRSCLYAQAISTGAPCFSVRELADRHADSALVNLLASRRTGEPSQQEYDECVRRLETFLAHPVRRNRHGSLEALIVNEWENPGDLLSIAFMALGVVGSGGDYAEIEKILL